MKIISMISVCVIVFFVGCDHKTDKIYSDNIVKTDKVDALLYQWYEGWAKRDAIQLNGLMLDERNISFADTTVRNIPNYEVIEADSLKKRDDVVMYSDSEINDIFVRVHEKWDHSGMEFLAYIQLRMTDTGLRIVSWDKTIIGQEYQKTDIDGVLTIGGYSKGDSLVFRNSDGSVWLSFEPFFQDDPDYNTPEGFLPLGFHPDYSLLVLRTVGREGGYYQVIVNENTRQVKNVDVNDSVFEFVSWRKFLLEKVNVISLLNSAKLYSSPLEGRVLVNDIEGLYFKVINIDNNNWMLVQSEEGNNKKGWLRWRNDNGTLNIYLYYFQ